MTMRIIICGNDYPQYNSKDMIKYCDKFYNSLKDNQVSSDVFEKATNFVSDSVREYKYRYGKGNTREIHRVKSFTQILIDKIKSNTPHLSHLIFTTNSSK